MEFIQSFMPRLEFLSDADWIVSFWLSFGLGGCQMFAYAVAIMFRWQDQRNREFIRKFNEIVLTKREKEKYG